MMSSPYDLFETTREAMDKFLAQDSDARAGMAWWNALIPEARGEWMGRAGNTGVAADAWEAYKRARGLGLWSFDCFRETGMKNEMSIPCWSVSPPTWHKMQLRNDCLHCEIDQLRGNLSLAEEGLVNHALEIERKNSLIDAQDEAQTSLHAENVRLREEIERLQAHIVCVKQARLDWAMVCECSCAACETFSNAIRIIGRGVVEPTPHESGTNH